MNKSIKLLLPATFVIVIGLLGVACSSNQEAIDQAVQQTMEAQEVQQTDQESSSQNVPDVNSSAQDISIEPTEPVNTPIDSNTNEHASPTPEETEIVTPSTTNSDSQRILFTASEEGIDNLFSIKPNGEDLQKVTKFDTGYLFSVSPDLSHVAYTTHNLLDYGGEGSVVSNSGMYIVPISNINNPSPELISRSEDIFALSYPIWSPDNSQIAMVGARLNNTEFSLYDEGLYVIDIEADEINFLVEIEAAMVDDLVWSPNGEQLAIISGSGIAEAILSVVNKDGSDLTELLGDSNSRIYRLAWSSDSTQITVNESLDDTTYTKTVDVNSGLITDRSDDVVTDNRGVWFSDGSKVAFVSINQDEQPYDSNREIYVLNNDGSGLIQFTEYDPNTVWDSCPIWSPDGTQLAFISRYLTDENIAELIASDGENRIVLMRDSEDMRVDCPLAWTP